MNPEPRTVLSRTIEHFKEIARQNRFAENGNFEHDSHLCLICHPELFPVDPFVIYPESGGRGGQGQAALFGRGVH